jgi:hypothetical protein
MPFFWKPYTSEMTDLITELRKAKPSLRRSSGAAAACSGTSGRTRTSRGTSRPVASGSSRTCTRPAPATLDRRRGGRAALRRAALRPAGRPLHPADALEVILDAFEGPLDLLLYLIRRQNFDILDIRWRA